MIFKDKKRNFLKIRAFTGFSDTHKNFILMLKKQLLNFQFFFLNNSYITYFLNIIILKYTQYLLKTNFYVQMETNIRNRIYINIYEL